MADVYERMADMYYINGVYGKALYYCRLALSIEKSIHGSNNILTLRLYKRAAEICIAWQDYGQTLKYGIKVYRAITSLQAGAFMRTRRDQLYTTRYINFGMPQALFSDWLAGECLRINRQLPPKPVGKHHRGRNARNAAYQGDGNAVTRL